MRSNPHLVFFYSVYVLFSTRVHLFFIKKVQNTYIKLPYLKLFSALILYFILILNFDNAFKNLQSAAFEYYRHESTFDIEIAESLYLNYDFRDPNHIRTQNNKNLNLILIYLESLGDYYLNEKKFPQLLPNLKQMLKESIYFSNIEHYDPMDWTMGAIFASQCGAPAVFQPEDNDEELDNNLGSDFTCLGDILNKDGYFQVFMGGARLSFGGKGNFFKIHGYDQVLGMNELLPLIENQKYVNVWGLYDDSLFQLAEEKIDELASNQQPFNFTLLTLDTHNGFRSLSCPTYTYSDDSKLQSVYCTDYLLGKFYDKIRLKPFWNNTVMMVMSDHPSNDESKIIAFALNQNNKIAQVISDKGAHVDIAPTVLDILGIQTNTKFILGESLINTPNPRRLISLDSKRGINIIRAIMLNRIQEQTLCGFGGFSTIDNKRIKINGKMIEITSMDLERQSKGSLFAIRFNKKGDIASAKKIGTKNLQLLFIFFPESYYLIIGKDFNFQNLLNDWTEFEETNYSLYFGKPSSQINAFSLRNIRWDDLKMSRKDCREVFIADHKSQTSPEMLIAHAGGIIKGVMYTNSLEAINNSYNKGFRYIELDFNWTNDGELVLIHDWDDEFAELFDVSPEQYSFSEFKNFTMIKKLTQLYTANIQF